MTTYEQYLLECAVPKGVIDVFLDPSSPSWAQFDPEVGYILGNSLPHDGLDNCWTISTSQPNGARTSRIYSDRLCRINTYGNSFTQCHQVGDAETWQEYLAAHLGEPIRNFGMGGFGVYQVYRRMLRAERSDDGAQHVILYIWGDDHCRSVMRCRNAVTNRNWDDFGGLMFHGNYWSNIELDLESGEFEERDSLLPTRDSLYRMSEPEFMLENLRDDLMVQLSVAAAIDPSSFDLPRLNALADHLGVTRLDPESHDIVDSAEQLRFAYGFAATEAILEKTRAFCARHDRKLMVFLLCPRATRQLLRGETRYDHQIPDYLAENGYLYFDMNRRHLEDYESFNLSVEDYMSRYFIGHYSPAGNHFFAFSVKNAIVDWLDPKPLTYRDDGSRAVEFKGYLPES